MLYKMCVIRFYWENINPSVEKKKKKNPRKRSSFLTFGGAEVTEEGLWFMFESPDWCGRNCGNNHEISLFLEGYLIFNAVRLVFN